jgi:hypothetical protein
MIVFLSARYSRIPELKRYRDILNNMSRICVMSRWLDTQWDEGQDTDASHCPPEKRSLYAAIDLEDVSRCDLFIAFSEIPRTGGRGGRHVEFGIALAQKKQICVVGPPENIFHFSSGVLHYPSFTQLLIEMPVFRDRSFCSAP